jgi:hypothetical protein
MSEENTPTPPNAEQAADLAALQASATSGDAVAATAPAGQPEAAQGPDLAQEIAGLVTVAVATLSPIFPSLKGIYTDETTAAASNAVAMVCKKHGWLSGGMMGNYGEEIACLAIVGPLAFATYQGVHDDLEAKRARDKTEKLETIDLTAKIDAPSGPMDSGSKTVTFGAPVPAES